MTDWTEISKKQYDEFGKTPQAPALAELEKRIKDLENSVSIALEIQDKYQRENELLKKNFQIERETHQADMMAKDIEIGRLMKKINLK